MNQPPTSAAGRPPGPHDDTLAKVLPTATRLLLDEGGAALTPTRLHQETGVARATIYRNWPDPSDLVEIMLTDAADPPTPIPHPSTGDLAADLRSAMDVVVTRLQHRTARAFCAACIEYGRRSERVAVAAKSFITGILAPIHLVIDQAIRNGRLEGEVDGLVAELTGPVVMEQVLLGRPVDTERGRQLVEHFVAHHRPRIRQRRSRSRVSA